MYCWLDIKQHHVYGITHIKFPTFSFTNKHMMIDMVIIVNVLLRVQLV